jgi:hypothetical protein
MSMQLTKAHLQQIISTIEALEKIPGEVKTVVVMGHDVHLKRVEDQRDGGHYLVQGITDKTIAGPVYREDRPRGR